MDRIRHKQSNRFKFQSFAERISKINIDVFHRIPHRYEEDAEESSTFFYLAIQKWSVLNLTENFKSFKKDIGYEISTLPQLINNREAIVQVFLKHLKLQNEMSLRSILETLVAFVKDIRYEFYPFFPNILEQLILLLKMKDPEILEATFTCLAYIFKYLSKKLVKDIDEILMYLAPLLNSTNPDYIRDFAAQSFAFVARKVKDIEKFLMLVLQTVQDHPYLLEGISQLIFHMLYGINRQSHSIAESLLQTLFNSFCNPLVPQKLLFLMTKNVINSYGNAVAPQHSVLFEVLLSVLKETTVKKADPKSIKYLLKIAKLGLECKSGEHLKEDLIPKLTNIVFELLPKGGKIQKISCEICGNVLILSKLKISQDLASLLVSKVLSVKETEIFFSFIDQVINFSSFETLVLPQLLKTYCDVHDTIFLQYLAKIIIYKVKLQHKNYDNLDTPVYQISLDNSSFMLMDKVLEVIEKFDPYAELTNDIMYALIIICHISPNDHVRVQKLLLQVITETLQFIGNSITGKENHLLVLGISLESLLYFKNDFCHEFVDKSVIFSALKFFSKTESMLTLRIINLILTIVKDFKFSEDLHQEIFCNVQKFVQWPHSNARFLALHSLQCLEKFKVNISEKSEINMSEILQICLNIEVIPLTISDYREKIKELQKLKYSSIIPLNDEQYLVIIRYLLGILYCNFQLLWDPISEVLSTYATNIPSIFWDIFYNHLCFVSEICKKKENRLNEITFHAAEDFVIQNVRFISLEDVADYNNYRFLMWKAMALFSELCETKNRDIITLYLSFIQEEFLQSNSHHNSTINIKQQQDEDMDIDDDPVPLPSYNFHKKKNSSCTIKWAIAHLNLLSKFKNPRDCYKESEVRNSYYDLLQHKNLEIQKLALECLFTYKFKYMIPYKQNLKNLIDDMKFKDEIVYFQIDKENGVIKQNHRDELMPIVMRILHNKMLSRSAVKRGSKGSAALSKRSIVFRFLAGCSDSEMQLFFQMAFMAFESHQKANSQIFIQIMNSVNLEKVTSPKKLQNIVNLADAIVEHFGGLMSVKLQRYILKILFSVGAIIVGIFSQREKVFAGYITSLKNTRNANTDCLAKFFDRLSFPWNEDEINTVFEIFIWPNLKKLPAEAIYNPTATIRIFSIWSENPRYHKLFARHKINDVTITPLPFLIKLLMNEKSKASVTSCIISIIEKLLILKEEMTDENINEDKPLELNNILQVDECLIKTLSLSEELNYGSQILIPHVNPILTYLRKKLEKSDNNLQKTEFTVLSRITELATSPENADALMMIAIRLLIANKSTNDETIMNTITTVENLTKIVNKPMSYLKSLATLLNSLETLESRKILINALLNIQNRCPELNESLNIIKDLNAFNEKWVNQPDFEKRVSTYKKINELAFENKIDLNLAIMVLYNSFYIIRCDLDLSMRDISSHCLKQICPVLANNWKENKIQNQFWIESILKLIHGGIVGKNENLHYFSVSLLGVMTRECGTLHAVLEDLAIYTNKKDLEVDFFENIIHLQIHRRSRALLRFCSLSKTLINAPKTRTLVQFILPLATKFLFNEKYATKNSLIDSAIQCVGVVCKFLPWYKYQTLLRYYLSKFQGNIEYQRQLIRVVIAILDSFHFDISKSNHLKVDYKFGISDYQNSIITSDEKMEVEEETEEKEVIKEYTKENELLKELHDDDENFETQDKKNKDVKSEDISENITLPYESITVLDASDATRVEKAISGPLLNQLFKAIGQRTQIEDTHKSNYKNLGSDRDQEDVQRIPIAVTLIKLLQKISKTMLENHLPGILMKLCTFLKSKLESVRRVTRETMQEIIVSLGPQYLYVMFSEMTSALTKGFQLHVLIFTMHAIIQAIQPQLQRGDLDKNLPTLLHVCKTDIFGQPAEEKAVKQIQVKHKEVRSTKSYCLLHLIAQNITEKCLTDLLIPIKNVRSSESILLTSHSHKVIAKSRECLRHVVLGLCDNEFIKIDDLFIFIYGITSESIPKLFIKEKVQEEKKNTKEKKDCFIIPKEPKSRMGMLSNPVKENIKSNDNVLIEFGFQLLQFLLKKEKLKTVPNFKSYLDSLIPILVQAIESRHVKVSVLALNCLCKMFIYNLPKLKELLDVIINELFTILYKYGAPGLSKGETFELVIVSYKAVCTIMKDTDYQGINVDKLKILLLYVEQDIYNNQRQASAFNLLKAILKRKLSVPELFDLMKKVAELSVTSELAHVRLQARQAVFRYVMDYPFGKQVEYFIKFYISQLSFELESGKQSALEMIHDFITSFPQRVLKEQCGLFLITLGARLINDDSPDCKKGLSGVIKLMLTRLEKVDRDQLYNICTLWFKQQKLSHKRLAAQLIGIFATIEKSDFIKKLPDLLPLIQSQFTIDCSNPKQFVHVANQENEERAKDYHLFQVMLLLLKICSHCPNFLIQKEYQESVYFFTDKSHNLLSHPHEWVRLSAMQFLGCLLNSINPLDIAAVLNGEKITSDLAFLEPTSLHSRIRSLILDHVAQFVPGIEAAKESIEQAAKNLIFFSRVLKDLKETNHESTETEMSTVENSINQKVGSKKFSMLWLIRRMRGIVNREIAETPNRYYLRTGVLKWTGGIATCFSSEELCKILYHLIAPLVREIDILEGQKCDNPFKSLVMEVTKILKDKVGVEKFTDEAVKIRKRLFERKLERKTKRAQEFVTNPEKAAKRKIEKQAKKKLTKKRRIEAFKGKGLKQKSKGKKPTKNNLV